MHARLCSAKPEYDKYVAKGLFRGCPKSWKSKNPKIIPNTVSPVVFRETSERIFIETCFKKQLYVQDLGPRDKSKNVFRLKFQLIFLTANSKFKEIGDPLQYDCSFAVRSPPRKPKTKAKNLSQHQSLSTSNFFSALNLPSGFQFLQRMPLASFSDAQFSALPIPRQPAIKIFNDCMLNCRYTRNQVPTNDPKVNKQVVITAVRKCGLVLEYTTAFTSDKDVVLAAVSQNGLALKFAASELRGDPEIVMAAVRQDAHALEYAAGKFIYDNRVVLAAISQNPSALLLAATRLQVDKQFILAAVKRKGDVLQYADRFKSDKEVVLGAIKQYSKALIYASETLQSDVKFLIAAVQQNGAVLQHVSESLRSYKYLVLESVKQKGLALQYASDDLKSDREVVLAAVNQYGKALQYAAPVLMKDKEVVIAAAIQNEMALMYAPPELRNDINFKREFQRLKPKQRKSWNGCIPYYDFQNSIK